MSAIVRYLAGGALALSSQGFFAVSFGLPSAMSSSAMSSGETSSIARLQDVRPAAPVALLQQVDRTHKGDRLPNFNAAPDPVPAGNEFVANEIGTRRFIKPAVKPAKPASEQKLPEGCNASISPLSDRIAANQASNCITLLELPWKVASAG